MDTKDEKTCEGGCGSTQLVIAQYGISLRSLGLSSRFCSSCLYAELKRLGHREDDADELGPDDDVCVDGDGEEWPEHDYGSVECRRCGAEAAEVEL